MPKDRKLTADKSDAPGLSEFVAALDSRIDTRNSPQRSRFAVPMLVALLMLISVNMYLLTSQLREAHEKSDAAAFWQLSHVGLTPDQRAERFLQLVAAENKVWQGAILDNLDLKGVDLSNVDVQNAVFSQCDFSDAKFVKAMLKGSGLDLSNFSNSDFSMADLRNTTFFKSTLIGADFRQADLTSASLEQTRAQGAKFVTAQMGDCFMALADLSDADLTGADLSGAHLEAATLVGADLALANFYGAMLEDADFSNSNWWRARGLDSRQLERFTLQFPPTSDSSESRQRDFAIWLSKQEKPGEK